MKKILSIKNKIMSQCCDMAYEGTPSVLWDRLEAQVTKIAEHLHAAQECLRDMKKHSANPLSHLDHVISAFDQYGKHIDIAHAMASGDPEINAALGHNKIPLPLI